MKTVKKTIKELPDMERPYEKCLEYGASFLTDSELLAVILKTGSEGCSAMGLAEAILGLNGEGLLGLHNITVEELRTVKGIGKVKAIQLLCVSELAKRMAKLSFRDRLNFDNSASVAEYYMEDMRHLKREKLLAVFLDSKLRKICDTVLSVGTVRASYISPREIFTEALKHEAVFIILLHNHPSGDPSPSVMDVSSTVRVKECGSLIGIELIDHIVIGDRCFVSMKERGLI